MEKDIDYYNKGEISPSRELAIEIIEVFEDVLENNNITIPDEDREEEEEEARIYGTTYYNLEDEITKLIEEFENKKRRK